MLQRLAMAGVRVSVIFRPGPGNRAELETVCRGRGGTHRVSRNHRRLWCRGLGASSFYRVSGRAARRRIIGQGDVRYVGVPRVLLIHAQISTVAMGDAVPAAAAAMIVTIAVPPVMTTAAPSALSRYQRSSAGANQSANRCAAAAAS